MSLVLLGLCHGFHTNTRTVGANTPGHGLTLISTMTPFQAWKSRRRKKLVEAFDRTFGPRKTAHDWQDFLEAEFAKFQRGEIPVSKYLRDKSQPGAAQIKPL